MIQNDLFKFSKKASSIILLAFSIFGSTFSQEIFPLNSLNSSYDEQHPVVSLSGEIFYSVGFHPKNLGGSSDFGDIWMAKKSEFGYWDQPIHVKSLSTSGNDVLIGFPNASTAYVYHSGTLNGLKQGIHHYSRSGLDWNYVGALEMGNFKNQGDHFSGRLSADNRFIIMSMSSYGSFGNEDIYISEQIREGIWTSPQNLGSDINTDLQEQTPFLSADLSTIYYASNSNKLGRGKNIFLAKRTGESWDSWSKSTPLKKVNSQGVELDYVIFDPEKNLALFTSIQNSEGFGDLMIISHQIEEQELAEDSLASDIKLKSNQIKEKINISELDSIPIEEGISIVLNKIQFDQGTSDFANATTLAFLDDLVYFMKVNTTVRIRIEGHTDNAGDPQLNKELSLNRAAKIRAYMTSKGVDFERIRIMGWGASKPIADHSTEEGKSLNRRVEMLIERIQ